MDSRSRRFSLRLRARLKGAGQTYRSFAQKLGVSEYTVKAAVHCARGGPKAKRVVEAIEKLAHAA